MAQQQLLRTKLVQVPFPALDCPRYCWDALRASTSRNTTLFTQASQRRRTQTRGLSSCRTTSSSSTFHPQPRRHPAAPALLHPRSVIWNGRYSVKTAGLLAVPAITQASSSTYSSFFSTSAISRAEAPASTPQAARPEPPDYLDEKERAIFDRLNEALSPIELQVEDISGGCGSMYAVAITAAKFKGLTVIKQHRLVNEVLGEEIKKWHGIQLRTKAA